MAFTVREFEDLLRILEQNPEWRARMRQAILTPELLELPELVRQLIESVRQLTEAQRRSDARIDELAQIVRELAEAQRRTEAQVAELAEAQRRTEAQVAELAEAQRRTEAQVAELAEAQRRTDARLDELAQTVRELVEAQRRTDAQIAQLVETQQRHEERLNELTEIVRDLVQVSRDMLRRIERLENWQAGETGRREGERFERETLARAPALFYGGTGGGCGEPHIRDKVGKWLLPLYRQGIDIPATDDPLLADIIWWKGDRVLVAEVGIKISISDVRRAKARANILRQVGVDATPVVIGEEWATPDTEALAQQEGVEWYVRGGLSAGFLEFRKLPDESELVS